MVRRIGVSTSMRCGGTERKNSSGDSYRRERAAPNSFHNKPIRTRFKKTKSPRSVYDGAVTQIREGDEADGSLRGHRRPFAMSLTFRESQSMTRPRRFRPACLQLEQRLALSGPSLLPIPTFATAEVLLTKSTSLKLNGVSPWGFPFRGSPTVGDPIFAIQLGGRSQNITANGVKVPNSPDNAVVPAEGNVVARVGRVGGDIAGHYEALFYCAGNTEFDDPQRELDA